MEIVRHVFIIKCNGMINNAFYNLFISRTRCCLVVSVAHHCSVNLGSGFKIYDHFPEIVMWQNCQPDNHCSTIATGFVLSARPDFLTRWVDRPICFLLRWFCDRLGKYRMPFAWTAIHLMNIVNSATNLRPTEEAAGASPNSGSCEELRVSPMRAWRSACLLFNRRQSRDPPLPLGTRDRWSPT